MIAPNRTHAPPTPAALLPHRGAMLWVDTVDTYTVAPPRLTCSATLRADNPALPGAPADGSGDPTPRLPAAALLELMAQAAGLLLGISAAATTERPAAAGGYLVRVRSLDLSVASLAVGDRLTVTVEQRDSHEGLARFAAIVRHKPGGQDAARGAGDDRETARADFCILQHRPIEPGRTDAPSGKTP